VRPLVGQGLLDAFVIGFGEHGLHVSCGQAVIAGPRLVTPQRSDGARDGGAILLCTGNQGA
jgi:hypothetical protein